MPSSQAVAAVVPARNEAERIADTVAALRRVDGVEVVVVVDDSSSDATAELARGAGALVSVHPRHRGKAAALMTGVAVVRDLPGTPPGTLLFADGDLGDSAVGVAPLLAPIRDAAADLAIAVLPPQEGAAGLGLGVQLARDGIRGMTGWDPRQPLSGIRCLTREAYECAAPLARGWGVEVGLTIDVLLRGLRVVEVPCDLRHRATGADWRGRAHRAAQYRDVWLALASRRLRERRSGDGHSAGRRSGEPRSGEPRSGEAPR
ncbi:MAG TPA: glycosyltransferase [Segeticoccus sp.]|uniref:glycosyltransferase n=1 Tax=Segeticoccus sp. TaxID=2706531 RepID=UPI002D802FE1|nr:glycosyltransferase [Segeticoccus sp.]HET8601967.1 glycosyltransferase [Segeticoccus sp.]